MKKKQENQVIAKPDDFNLDAVKVLNGSHSEAGNNTIPSDPTVAWLMSQMKSLNLDNHDKVFNNTSSGFEKYCLMLYRDYVNFVSSNWDYNDEFLDSLGIDKYKIDENLIEKGTMALIKVFNKFYLMPYNIVSEDIYKQPDEIKIVGIENEFWKDRVFSKNQYVIIDNDPTKWNILVKNIAWVQVAYRTMCEIYENIYSGATKYLQLVDGDWDLDAANNALALNDFVSGKQKVQNISPKERNDLMQARGLKADSWSKWKDSVIPFDFKSRLDELWNTFYNAYQEILKVFGMTVNSNVNKKERQINNEITAQQDVPFANRMAMFNKRKIALEQCNKMFNTNFDITLIEKEPLTNTTNNLEGDDLNELQ